MTIVNKPEVVAYLHTNEESQLKGISLRHDESCTNTFINTEPLIRLSDYQRLQVECEKLRADLAESRANDRQAMYYLNQVREIIGGGDYPDMVRRCKELLATSSESAE